MFGVSLGIVGIIAAIGSQGEAAGSSGRGFMLIVALSFGLVGAGISVLESPGRRR